MKKIMKVFVSILVMAMMVSLVPVQQVKAVEYVFIPDAEGSYVKSEIKEELLEDEAFFTEDSRGAKHEFGYGYFKDGESEDEAIFAFSYLSDRKENKADYFVVEMLYPSTENGNVAYPGDQYVWEILGEDAIYLEFPYDTVKYNGEYLYLFAGIVDTETGYVDGVNFKIKNKYQIIPIYSINLDNERSVAIGKTTELTVGYYPETATIDRTITWTSSDESVAKVENGIVTGVSYGKATITATTVNGKTDSCEVTVGDVLEGFAFEQEVYNINHSGGLSLLPVITPSTAAINYDRIKWEISNESVLTFGGHSYGNDKLFRTLAPGTTTITATTDDGFVASCVVNIDAPITSIRISSYGTIDVRLGNTRNLGSEVMYTPSNTNHDKTLTWVSSDESIATVDEHGVVTGISEGSVIITATTTTGISSTQEVRILPAIAIEEVRINSDVVDVFVEGTYNCGAGVYPVNTSMSTTLTWTSSDEKVATVDQSGVITGVASGTCVVTATSVNGKSDSITVNVSEGATRIYGNDRYQTAFKVADTLKSQLKKDKFSSVIVASGTGFADALAGSYLSAAKEAPILMTDKKLSNINKLVDYINKNLAKDGTVYILGGTAAVSSRVDQLLSSYNVKRLYGNNRYATNIAILDEVMPTHYNGDLLICTGTNFADSLSVSATGLPIMLVGSHLTNEQRSFLSWSEVGHVYVIGGEAAVSKRLVNEIKNALPEVSMTIGGQEVDISAEISRIAGNSRYETSTMVANKFLPNAEKAVLAYAQNYPDGLSGGALAYAIKAPLLLTDGYNYSTTSKHTIKKGITSGFVLGGNGLVTDKAVRNIFGLTKDQAIDSK